MLSASTDFILSSEEATSLFDESIEAIIDAFDQQREVASTKITVSYTLRDRIMELNRNFQMAFLVGGLGNKQLRLGSPSVAFQGTGH